MATCLLKKHTATSFQKSLFQSCFYSLLFFFFWSFLLLNCSQDSYNLDLYNTTRGANKNYVYQVLFTIDIVTWPNLGLCTKNVQKEISYTNIQQPRKGYCKTGIKIKLFAILSCLLLKETSSIPLRTSLLICMPPSAQ